MGLKTKPWDTTEFLDTRGRVAAYAEAVLEGGDMDEMRGAIGEIARAIGLTEIAREVGLPRTALYPAFVPDEGLTADVVQRVLRVLATAAPDEADAAA